MAPRPESLRPLYRRGTEAQQSPRPHDEVGRAARPHKRTPHTQTRKRRGRAGRDGKVPAAPASTRCAGAKAPGAPDSELGAWRRPGSGPPSASLQGPEGHGDTRTGLAGDRSRPARLLAAPEVRAGPGLRQRPGRVQSRTARCSGGPASRARVPSLASRAGSARGFGAVVGPSGPPEPLSPAASGTARTSTGPAPPAGALPAPARRRPGRAPCRQPMRSAPPAGGCVKPTPLSWVLTVSP